MKLSSNIRKKNNEKLETYQGLKEELEKMWIGGDRSTQVCTWSDQPLNWDSGSKFDIPDLCPEERSPRNS